MPLLEVRDLVTGFGSNQVLNGIDLDVEPGTVAVLLGLNGAGKSVTLKAVSGLQPTWSGSIRFKDREVSGLEAEDRIRAGLGHVLQSKAVFAQLTVLENLRLGAACVKDKAVVAATRQRVLDIYPRLHQRSGQLAGSLSGGEQAMLAVARALMTGPELLLVDEPSAGLSPIMVEGLGETLRQVAAAGTTLLMVEQNVGFGLELADEVHVLERGRVVYRNRGEALDMAKVSELLGIGDLLAPPPEPVRPRRASGPRQAAAKKATVKKAATTKKATVKKSAATNRASTHQAATKTATAKTATVKRATAKRAPANGATG